MYVIQHCFICHPSDSTALKDAGIEPRTDATCNLKSSRSRPSRDIIESSWFVDSSVVMFTLCTGYSEWNWFPLCVCIPLKDKTHRRQCKMLSSKKLTCEGTLRQVFIRVYRLAIQWVMLVFSTQLCELLPFSPSLLFNSPPLPCVNKGGGYGGLGIRQIDTLPLSLFTGQFFFN